ncbi:uncharacterized protein EI90DRAFT_3037463 [Cantharellus anzutake]|uniref:uncharacterized protein n=1 Tax=Cantharellus anzutake TaxID=1750568 RepID=UPI00190744BD|nr:uncharacterized protein EI90DRAFT_3037463 [Cantharellus anzutake]KAF8339681.1 hypothetical protein EI90DRAFT_3037463 [Cantharellus anzutake]
MEMSPMVIFTTEKIKQTDLGQVPAVRKRRKRNSVFLNMKQTYGKTSAWNPTTGVRELLQNLWDGILERFSLSPWEIDVSEHIDTKNNKINFKFRYINSTPAMRLQLRWQPDTLLGEVKYSPKRQLLELVNYHVSLKRDVLMLGTTSKESNRISQYAIGGHGEGLKVGINALVRNHHKVTYYTNSEIWNFTYEEVESLGQKGLTVTFRVVPSRVTDDGRRNFTKSADQHTTVVVKGIGLDAICLDNYLFLRPCNSILAPTHRSVFYKCGYICLTEEHAGRLYVRGILVHRHKMKDTPTSTQPTLHYGYNILGNLPLSRDRGLSSDDFSLSEYIFCVWESLLSDSQTSAEAASRYINLFIEHQNCSDIHHADIWFAECAQRDQLCRLLLRTFCSLHKAPDKKIWIHGGDPGSEHVIHQIGRHPVKAPEPLYKIWSDAGIAWSPQKERDSIFFCLSPWSGPATPSAQHTIHLLDVMCTVDCNLSRFKFDWKNGGDIDMDLLVSDPTSTVSLHSRNLDPVHVHSNDEHSCSVYALWEDDQSSIPPPAASDSVICDCAAFKLYWGIRWNVMPPSASLAGMGSAQQNLASLYPRNPQVTSDPLPAVQWRINSEAKLLLFDVKIVEGYGDPGFMLHGPEGPQLRKRPPSFVRGAEASAPNSTSEAITHSSQSPSFVMKDVEGLQQGRYYTAQIAAKGRTIRAPYSAPFTFANPLPPVSVARYIRSDRENTLIEFSPVEGAQTYEITIHTATAGAEIITKNDCQISLPHQEKCTVDIVAITPEGIRSSEGMTIDVPRAEPEVPEFSVFPISLAAVRGSQDGSPPSLSPTRETSPSTGANDNEGSNPATPMAPPADAGSSSDESEPMDCDGWIELHELDSDELSEDSDYNGELSDDEEDEVEVNAILTGERRRKRRRKAEVPRWERLTLYRVKQHRIPPLDVERVSELVREMSAVDPERLSERYRKRMKTRHYAGPHRMGQANGH